MTEFPPTLNKAQLELLKLMARSVSDDDLRAIKKLIVRYFADKLTASADDAWERNGWTNEDAEKILHTHLRTPYKPNNH